MEGFELGSMVLVIQKMPAIVWVEIRFNPFCSGKRFLFGGSIHVPDDPLAFARTANFPRRIREVNARLDLIHDIAHCLTPLEMFRRQKSLNHSLSRFRFMSQRTEQSEHR
jgi:hypothetical protein